MNRLGLSEWASIAEVIGAAAVVLSLVYVGIQVRENTEEIRAANRQQLVARSHTATLGVSTSPELAGAVAKVINGERLSAAEQVQYGYFVRAMLYDIQEAYLLHQEGRLDDDYWETREAIFRAYMAQEPARAIFERDKSLDVLHDDFIGWAEQTIFK